MRRKEAKVAEKPPTRRIRRIVVLADPRLASRSALEAAAELASRGDLELLGLFVEDEDLLRTARMPFAREVGATSATARPMDPEQLERTLRARAAEIRRLLNSLEGRLALRWSLKVARGRAVAEVLAVAGPDDLLVVQRTGGPSLRGGPGATIRDLLREPRVSVMVLPETLAETTHPVVALFDDPEGGPRALEMAAHLARGNGQELTVVIPPVPAGEGGGLAQAAREWLDRHGVRAHLHQVSGPAAPALAELARRDRARALVISRGSPVLADAPGRHLLESLGTPMVVVS